MRNIYTRTPPRPSAPLPSEGPERGVRGHPRPDPTCAAPRTPTRAGGQPRKCPGARPPPHTHTTPQEKHTRLNNNKPSPATHARSPGGSAEPRPAPCHRPSARCLPSGGELLAVREGGEGRRPAPGSDAASAPAATRPALGPPPARAPSRPSPAAACACARAPRPASQERLSSPPPLPASPAGSGAPPHRARSAAASAPPRRTGAHTDADPRRHGAPRCRLRPAGARSRARPAAPAPGPPPPTPTCAPGGPGPPLPLFFPLFA